LRPVTSGEYSVVSGAGGLKMKNSAKILGGDVKINGEVFMENTSQIGLSTGPVNLEVAQQNCPEPANATYPRLCNLGESGQAIEMHNTSRIYGDVKANNQTNSYPTRMTNPGLTASSGVTIQPLPPYDRDAQKAAVASTQTGAAAECSSGSKTWPANLKITGDVTVSNTCKVTVSGDVWITGKLTVQNSAQLIVADSVGSTKPNIMVDDHLAKFQNSARLQSNASNTGFQIINYWSTASCSPDCADVTGIDLYNSRNQATVELSNSASGPNTVFYARWSRVLMSNSGQLGAIVGQTVELTNTATITFGTSSGVGGTTYWVVDGYRRTL
jgi:hypothetical protein